MSREGNEAVGLEVIATQRVELVEERFGCRLDWSLESLGELDRACDALPADGPLAEERWSCGGSWSGPTRVRCWSGRTGAAGSPTSSRRAHRPWRRSA
jgi:hypothetical protein